MVLMIALSIVFLIFGCIGILQDLLCNSDREDYR